VGDYPFASVAASLYGTLIYNEPTQSYAELVFPRSNPYAESGLISQAVEWAFFQPSLTIPVSWVMTMSGGTAASGVTASEIGLYSVPAAAINNINQAENVTELASVSDATMWLAPYTPYARQLSGQVLLQAGQYYGLAIYCNATQPPSLLSAGNMSFSAPYLGGAIYGASGLPSSELFSNLNDPDYLIQAQFSAYQIQ